jgi:hypothetical protein
MVASPSTERLTPESIPDWVPAAVKSAALALPYHPVVERLVTDDRMKTVWRYLLRQDADMDHVWTIHLFGSLPVTWWNAQQSFAPQETACAAFLTIVVDKLVRKQAVITRAKADAEATPYFDAARLCRDASDRAQRSRMEFEPAQALGIDLSKALDIAAAYLHCYGRGIEQANLPFVITRSVKARGDDELRVKTRLVAMQMFAFFGSLNLGLAAKVVSVALGVAVSKKDAENWCADIPACFEGSQ